MDSVEQIITNLGNIRCICFNMEEHFDPYANEVWISFQDGTNIMIDLEKPFPSRFDFMHPAKGWFSCSENKKDNFIQYYVKEDILNILNDSKNYKCNLSNTIDIVVAIFKTVKGDFIYKPK